MLRLFDYFLLAVSRPRDHDLGTMAHSASLLRGLEDARSLRTAPERRLLGRS